MGGDECPSDEVVLSWTRWSPAPGACVPELEQVTCPVGSLSIRLREARLVAVLGDGVAGLAEDGSKPAQGDLVIRINPQRGRLDPGWRLQVDLRGKPAV